MSVLRNTCYRLINFVKNFRKKKSVPELGPYRTLSKPEKKKITRRLRVARWINKQATQLEGEVPTVFAAYYQALNGVLPDPDSYLQNIEGSFKYHRRHEEWIRKHEKRVERHHKKVAEIVDAVEKIVDSELY